MEYRRGRIAQEYRRWGRPARLARFRARSHSRNAYGGGQTGSFPFSEVSSHYEPSESCETNIRKRPVCPRVPTRLSPSSHRESFRASVLSHSSNQAVLQSTAAKKCLLTTPSLLSRGTQDLLGAYERATRPTSAAR